MTVELLPLSDLIPGWPATAPQTGSDLVLTSNDDLKPLALDSQQWALVANMRKHMRKAANQRGESAQLSSVSLIVEALSNGDLRVIPNTWTTFVLDESHRRVVVPIPTGSTRFVTLSSGYVPDPETTNAKIKDGGRCLITWGGSPDVLSGEGIVERFNRLFESGTPVSDVVFRHTETGNVPTIYSLRAGFGARGTQKVPFPDQAVLNELRTPW